MYILTFLIFGLLLFCHVSITILFYTFYGWIAVILYQLIACIIFSIIEEKSPFIKEMSRNVGNFLWNYGSGRGLSSQWYCDTSDRKLRSSFDVLSILLAACWFSPLFFIEDDLKKLYFLPVAGIGQFVSMIILGRIIERKN